MWHDPQSLLSVMSYSVSDLLICLFCNSNSNEGILSFIANLFELDILTNPKFYTQASCMLGVVFAFQAWIIYLVPHAITKGLSPYQGTSLASFGCVGQLIGLISSGLILDKGLLPEIQVSTCF